MIGISAVRIPALALVTYSSANIGLRKKMSNNTTGSDFLRVFTMPSNLSYCRTKKTKKQCLKL
jgi:hypothetical protein